MNWFRDNGTIFNPEKLLAISQGKRNSDLYLSKNITIGRENVEDFSNVNNLGAHIDSRLNLNL